MTDYTVPDSVAASEVTSAAKFNKLVTDILALWAGTTAGDMDYYSTAVRKARVPIGSDYDILTAISGVPTWKGFLTASPLLGSDHTVSGMNGILRNVSGLVTNFGDVVYIGADGRVHLGDADAVASSLIVGMCSDASIASNAYGNYLLHGFARDDTWNWTPGTLLYLSTTGTTGNTITATAPSAINDVVAIIGVAYSADVIYFNPQLAVVEHV